MNILSTIKKINNTFNDSEYSDLYGEATEAFSYGGCLAFVKILQKFYPNSNIVINKEKGHCALLINGVGYDTNGRINLSNFEIADESDILYAENEYGFEPDIPDDEVIEDIIDMLNDESEE